MSNMQFGIFGILDGHGGDEAAKSARKLVFSDLVLAIFDLLCFYDILFASLL